MAWLMPANMIINTEIVVSYNKLKQVVPGTKLRVNNGVNTDTKKAALKLMAGGPSKINPPNSHPSNPDVAQQGSQQPASVSDPQPQHETNKTAVIIGRVGLVALV